MNSIPTTERVLQDALEAEFCPPLDTTLVAAFLTDYLAINGEPQGDALQTLREQLTVLAASATIDQDNLANDFADLQFSAQSTTTEDSRDADSVFDHSGETSSSSTSSAPSHSPPAQLNSALAFLRASFPHLPVQNLKERLDHEELSGELDMERIVEELLSEDYVKELEERGLEGDETLEGEVEKWQVVSRRSSTSSNASSATGKKKKKTKGRTIAVNDMRQKQHVRPHLASSARSAGDPWNQIVSISSYLETLLLRPSAFFLSYFHKPEYATPSDALRAALNSINRQRNATSEDEQDQTSLSTLLEFMRASPDYNYDSLDIEACSQLCSDAKLSLDATNGSPDVALDIVKLLQEMEADKESEQEMGVYHSPVSPLSVSTSGSSRNTDGSPIIRHSDCSPPISPISSRAGSAKAFAPPSSVPRHRPPPAPNQSAWQQVRPARHRAPAVHPLADYIAAYNPKNVSRRKAPGVDVPFNSATLVGRGGGREGRSAAVLGSYKGRIDDCRARREAALRTASRYWKGGSARTRGGEVALFYTLEAQQHQAAARRLQLDAARELVEGKRLASSDHDTIDLHYCTTSEALTLVHEVLDEGWASVARPLRVITGRGMHSSGGIPVLGPVVKNALEREGWNVGKWEGGLVVRGRRKP